MNELSKVASATMSSREIAQLTGKEHAHVMRDIRNILIEAEIDESNFGGIYTDSMNRKQVIFNLPRRECDLVIAGYSVKYRLAIIDRWQELEEKNKPKELSRKDLALMVIDAENEIERLGVIVEQQKPAVEFVERYIESSGNKGFREVCKLLKVKENQFREFLIENKIMYRLNSSLTPYGNHLDAGRFEVNAGISETDHAFTQAKFTPKGISWVAGLWMAERIANA